MNYHIRALSDLNIDVPSAIPVTHVVYIDRESGHYSVACAFNQADAERVARAFRVLDALQDDELRLAGMADNRWIVMNHAGTIATIDELDNNQEINDDQASD